MQPSARFFQMRFSVNYKNDINPLHKFKPYFCFKFKNARMYM